MRGVASVSKGVFRKEEESRFGLRAPTVQEGSLAARERPVKYAASPTSALHQRQGT